MAAPSIAVTLGLATLTAVIQALLSRENVAQVVDSMTSVVARRSGLPPDAVRPYVRRKVESENRKRGRGHRSQGPIHFGGGGWNRHRSALYDRAASLLAPMVRNPRAMAQRHPISMAQVGLRRTALPPAPTRRLNQIAPKTTRPKLLGRDRQMTAPVASGLVRSTPAPRMRSRGNGVTVSHRELIGTVTASEAYAVSSYSINPGLAGVFPWLSSVARNYESYRFQSLQFEFCTTQSTAEPGSVMVYADADPVDEAPVDKLDFMSNASAVRSPVWNADLAYRVPSTVLGRLKGDAPWFVRSNVASTVEQNTTDVCHLVVATEGADATIAGTVLGEVYVSYTVYLATPHFDRGGAVFDGFMLAYATSTDMKNDLLGTATVIGNLAENGDVTLTAADPALVTFNSPGWYFVDVQNVGTGVSTVLAGNISGTLTAATSGTTKQFWNCGADNGFAEVAVGDTLSWDSSASTTITYFRVFILRLSAVDVGLRIRHEVPVICGDKHPAPNTAAAGFVSRRAVSPIQMRPTGLPGIISPEDSVDSFDVVRPSPISVQQTELPARSVAAHLISYETKIRSQRENPRGTA